MTNVAPFGSWPSPISAELVAAGGVGVGGPAVDGTRIWWSELRPSESGRLVLVSKDGDDAAIDRLQPPWSARTRVHEYGGGAWWLGADDLYFAEWSDQRLYRLPAVDDPASPAGPEPLTPEPAVPAGWRYADGREHPDGDWLVCVREDHHGIADGGKAEPSNEIVAIATAPADGVEPVVLVSGPDFVAAPRFSADGRWLSWIQWNHPNMPWDDTTLCAAPVFANMRIGNVQIVAGGGESSRESIHGADWTADGRLMFSSDRSGFWNLYAWSPARHETSTITELEGSEIGAPPWVFGVQRWTELGDGRLVVAVTTEAVDSLAVVEPEVGSASADELAPLRPLELADVSVVSAVTAAGPGRVALVGAGPTALSSVMELDVDSGAVIVRRPADDPGVDRRWYAAATPIRYESGGRQAHAFFYPPTGADMAGPGAEAPPLIVMGHGGPTSHAGTALSLKIQYWTSRGFAVVDVNYGGSSGFGRHYRELLQGTWGIVDVEDCVNAATHLAAERLVDGRRLAIRGGSAGGFTVLAALVRSDAFAAGTSLYGVADLTALAADTHKFESRYLDGLVGPFPQRRDLYDERSPINHTDRLSSPLLVLQGLEDEIVPPNQSEAIVAALAAKGVPHAYVAFEGEQHGFRRAETIIRSLEVELWFYGRILGFEPADRIEPPAGAVGLD